MCDPGHFSSELLDLIKVRGGLTWTGFRTASVQPLQRSGQAKAGRPSPQNMPLTGLDEHESCPGTLKLMRSLSGTDIYRGRGWENLNSRMPLHAM